MGTADGVIHVAHQRLHQQAWIMAAAEADPHVDALAFQVLQGAARLQQHFDAGMAFDEMPEARRQPARRKRGNRRDRQPRIGGRGPQRLRRRGDLRKSLAQHQRKLPSLRRDRHMAAVAQEQQQAQFFFQLAHLVADGAVRQVQFLGRARKIAVAGGRLEGAQC
ncbi:hypothetical protein D3C72_1852880 [compost metagenome]